MGVDQIDVAGVDRNVAARSRDGARIRSIWQWQLILAAGVVAIAVAVALLVPDLFGDARFGVGLAILIVLTCATLAAPWHRLNTRVVLLVPTLDIVGIAILASSNEPRFLFLWVFPVAWIATYYSLRVLVGALVLITVLLLSAGFTQAPLTPEVVLRILIVVISLGFMGVTINNGSRRTRAFSRLLRRQFAQLGRTLQRAEAQEHRATVFYNSIDNGLARVDRRGRLLAANTAYSKLYSIDARSFTQPSGAVEYDGYRGTALGADQTSLARAARGEVLDDERVWLFSMDGSWHALSITARPTDASPSEPASSILTVRDITAEIEAERERKTMTSVVSHELRNPLTAIVGHTDLLLERDDLPADALAQLAVIDNAAQRMQHLIASLLESTKARPTEVDETIDLPLVVAASIDAFRPAARSAQVSISEEIGDGLLTDGDAFRLRQVVDNLVGNAVKYTPRGGHIDVAVREGVRADEASPATIEIVVRDNGIGMSSDDLEHVFDPYFRSPSVRDSDIPGTGLGMGISHEIVQRHGGTLTLTSTLGKGTRAVVRLPAQKREGPA